MSVMLFGIRKAALYGFCSTLVKFSALPRCTHWMGVIHCILVDMPGDEAFGLLVLGTLGAERTSLAVGWVGFISVIACSGGGAVAERLSCGPRVAVSFSIIVERTF